MVTVGEPPSCVVVVFAIGVNVVNGATFEDSQRTTVPVEPVNVKLPTAPPAHTALFPLIVPATEGASTVTSVLVELASAQSPLFTTALKKVVAVSGPEVSVGVVLAMVVTDANVGEVELSQRTTDPI